MKKLLQAILLAGLFAGCGIDYDGSTKLVFEGTVVAADGTPLEGIKVSTHISNSYDHDEISYDFTDSNGHYLMIFPKASEEVDVELDINNANENNGLSRTSIVNIDFEQANDFKIDFGTQGLYEIENSVALHINFSNTIYPEKISLTGLVADNRIDYNFTTLPDPEGEGWINTDFQVAQNQLLTLRYLLWNGSVHEVQIPIGEDDVTYTVE